MKGKFRKGGFRLGKGEGSLCFSQVNDDLIDYNNQQRNWFLRFIIANTLQQENEVTSFRQENRSIGGGEGGGTRLCHETSGNYDGTHWYWTAPSCQELGRSLGTKSKFMYGA